MRFQYQARDATGRVKTGELNAGGREDAARQLRQEGCYLLNLEEMAEATTSVASVFRQRVSRTEIIYLTNQLSIMLEAGVALAPALEGISRQTENQTLRAVLAQVQSDVEGGEDLSMALAKFPRVFDRTYVNLVKASEASGTLATMLDRIATQNRKELETRQKVQGAMMYPAAMVVMCVGVCIFLLTYVFPKITPMFVTRGLILPAPTRVMMFLSQVLTQRWPWLLVAAVLFVAAAWYIHRQSWGRRAFDWLWLHVPILGPVCRKVALTRSMRTLATTINAGVPMLEALQLSGGVASNSLFEDAWNEVSVQVESGKQICEVMEGHRLFPATLVQMVSSGERTGKLGYVLNKVSDYFDREVELAIKSATGLIEPIMVAVMGGVIGSIALAMLLPIFKLSTSH